MKGLDESLVAMAALTLNPWGFLYGSQPVPIKLWLR